MFKIEIREQNGREVHLLRDHFVYLKEPNGREHLWEWSHFSERDAEIKAIYENARLLSGQIQEMLPDLPMSAIR